MIFFRCIIIRKDGDIEAFPEIVCENVKEAEHLASTLALFKLCGGQVKLISRKSIIKF